MHPMGFLSEKSIRRRPTNDSINDLIITGIITLGSIVLLYWWHLDFHDLRPSGNRNRIYPRGTRDPAYLIKAYNGAVAAENELCSKMGVGVLKQGGNAVDAAISATLCTGVVNMFSSGIGGGGFMIVRLPPESPGEPSEVWSINFRETAPALSNQTMYENNPLGSRYGGLAVGVPGEIRGLQEAHRRWGTIPWKDLVEPAAKLAARWRVQKELARRIQMYSSLMLDSPDWSAIFAPQGMLLKEGDRISRANYSRTLSIIAEQGPDAFYDGPIADALVEKVRQTGGILTTEDLKQYRVRVDKAFHGTYRGRHVYTNHAPGAGPLLLQMLHVLENYDLTERTPLNVHRVVETLKFAFASRTRMSDPASHNDTQRMEIMMTKEYAHEIYTNITDDKTHPPEYYNPEYGMKPDHGTSHTSIIDRNGMAVSLTTTVNSVFGCHVLDPTTGMVLNDEMDDFSVPDTPNDFGLWPSPYNFPLPGKRPVSSTAPTIIENADGSIYASIGGAGGARIFGSILQVLLNLDWGLDASEAVEFSRLHDQLYPLVLDADEDYPSESLEFLRRLGHNVTVADINRIAAVVQLVVKRDGVIYAASDSRKNGIAAGY
ncbi:gamma-glutamyltransferase [Agaricus bisporus var. bisporus H97]|uniref:gamma-glutamyltransferase n=1 Tax=Agaricus bisporus var. bisporus (strain H97 / ATCC MYA-4626 / FGSC 10389) TaxID=936046 RepID=UPI00029F747D|nr:gamma-glutamyltransferase [Agaricus bisporus var. bisporus H97]EKV47856.1 gamma-glutamyltransferase [Agaricus bisporus var. bisporus H97]